MFCDDITNTRECGMDGGDCCDPHSFFFACHHCVCFDMSEYEADENAFNSEPPGGILKIILYHHFSSIFQNFSVCTLKQQKRIGDGICDDDVNVKECNFDGGDCCNPDADIFFCDDCICIQPYNETGKTVDAQYLRLFGRSLHYA